jgi:uncharacterized integral membrane protein (TIGR00698 family)
MVMILTLNMPKEVFTRLPSLVPGTALCIVISGVAYFVGLAETRWLGHPYIESIVVAIILGTIIRSLWNLSERWQAGIEFCARRVLEAAVVLFGAALSFASVASSGIVLVCTVVVLISTVLVFSYGVSRLLGLSRKMSMLIACGNSICGNSAIAAVAPVIGADGNEIGASISFTAILGVMVVLGLPLLVPLLDLSESQYGILAGLTVYAVPQVLAATVPVATVSTQIGTFVKLLRVLMLGPVVLALSVFVRLRNKNNAPDYQSSSARSWVPWFIPGFFGLMILRSFEWLSYGVISWASAVAAFLTILSMAALGLTVDLRLLFRIGVNTIAVRSLAGQPPRHSFAFLNGGFWSGTNHRLPVEAMVRPAQGSVPKR